MEKPKITAETVIITRDEYRRLMAADRKLDALERHGVDNWEWYGDAMRDLEEEDGRED